MNISNDFGDPEISDEKLRGDSDSGISVDKSPDFGGDSENDSENPAPKLPNLIGVGGTFASGKDILARELAENYGFTHASTGDMVRVVAQKRYGNTERPTLAKTAIELRDESGSGVLVERALELLRPLIVSGIRTAGEVKTLKNAGGVMVFVDAEPRIRYERMKTRLRDSETNLTFDEFLANESKEISGAKTDSDQNIGAVREMADLHLENNGTVAEFVAAAIGELSDFRK